MALSEFDGARLHATQRCRRYPIGCGFDLQAFYGALAGQKAKKGVFITTSTYSSQAVDFARSVEGIVLIDGARLAGLLIDHEVGITSRTVRIPKIDSDYFEDEAS